MCGVPGAVYRVNELGGLHEQRKARRPLLVVLSGGPGTGKSALGRKWAAEVRTFYPDGQWYADLRMHRRAGVVEVAAVVDGFLRALGVPREWLPEDAAHQRSMLRTLLRDKELLILVDHATAAAQVLSWLPDAPGVSVVVTSHHRLEELDQPARSESRCTRCPSRTVSRCWPSTADPTPRGCTGCWA